MGAEVKSTVKSKIASFTGSVAGMIDTVRDDALSKMLRDDYAALSMITDRVHHVAHSCAF